MRFIFPMMPVTLGRAPLALGSPGTLLNSQCSINVGASSGVISGNTYTLRLAITFQAAFTGAKNTYGFASQATGGLSSGWQALGTWTALSGAPQAVSASPSSGSGGSQLFTFVYTDNFGASDLSLAQVLFNTSAASANGCSVSVVPSSGAVSVAPDSGSPPLSTTLGTAEVIGNSECSLDVGASSATLSGNVYTLKLAIIFTPFFTGTKTVYATASTLESLNSRVANGRHMDGSHHDAIGIQLTPPSGSGTSQTFTFVYNDSKGIADVGTMLALFNTSLTNTNGCYVQFSPNLVQLAGDDGSWSPPKFLGADGGNGTLTNTQCILNLSASSALPIGYAYLLNLAITFRNGSAGTSNVYSYALSKTGSYTGWQMVGTWTVPALAKLAQSVVFNAIGNRIFGISPFPIVAQSSSGLAVGIASITPGVCKVSGGLVMLLSAGTCSLAATQSGNVNYNAAATVTRSFAVSIAKPSGTVPGGCAGTASPPE